MLSAFWSFPVQNGLSSAFVFARASDHLPDGKWVARVGACRVRDLA